MNWFWRIFFTIALLIGWGILGYLFMSFTLDSPKRTEPVAIEIPKNTSLKQVGKLLEEKKLIRRSYLFSFYVFMKDKTNLQAGNYLILPNEDIDSMLEKFATGKENVVTVTIPEGWDATKIANRLDQKKEGFDKEKFLSLLNNKEPKYNFEMQIAKNANRPYKLEGYLFPSTYDFPKNASEEEIINMMLAQFAKRVEKLQIRKQLESGRLADSNMTLDKLVTVASLVEREGKAKEEYPRIAGVIYNRLKSTDNQKLRIDATFLYITQLKEEWKNVPFHQLKYREHPYNTYIVKGLPPGPIANPGEQALMAALKPEHHKYEYYVTKGDGTGTHYFAETYSEHTRNVKLSNTNQQQRKKEN
ncbi:MAG: endolytic transglycosylase MltG [Thermoactinomyces sp.]